MRFPSLKILRRLLLYFFIIRKVKVLRPSIPELVKRIKLRFNKLKIKLRMKKTMISCWLILFKKK
jgi:hypothetical protein